MSGFSSEFQAHLDSGVTSLCRCWRIVRRDGVTLGFTDHDRPLRFGAMEFKPDSGLSAMALQQTTGLSVDNTEALGALSDVSISEADITAGRFDEAEVTAWMVNWADPAQRVVQFQGSIGEIRRAGGSFQAELRGLTEAMNQPLGRVYQKPCGANLGDGACGVDVSSGLYQAQSTVHAAREDRVVRFRDLDGYQEGWFARGTFEVLSGAAQGLRSFVKLDRFEGDMREVTLWEPLPAPLREGDQVRLTAGCDKRFETCRQKFQNLLNFRGFPDIPEEEWIMVHPANAGNTSGGSRR